MKVEILETRDGHRGYFHLQLLRLRFQRFDGTMGREVVQEVMRRNDAVAVLLYDPVADVVALVRQFRIGAHLNEARGWTLEVVAGLMNDGESDRAAAARRETLEETGLPLAALHPVNRFYLSPGGSTECVHLFLGIFDVGTPLPRTAGLAGEDEDIRLERLSWNAVEALLDEDRINNATSLVALLWLRFHRPRLRREAGIDPREATNG
ncbi:MAG: NUDIX domain-containing protein [Magnetococcales bacterium]|nr:NUDIX domain-containing protein [Magnetococcales bacterium]